MSNYYIITEDNELYHHGVKGMKWGVRRFQNKDGSLTPAGRKRYSDSPELQKQKDELKTANSSMLTSKAALNSASNRYSMRPTNKNWEAYEKAKSKYLEDKKAYDHSKLKYDTNKEAARIKDKGITFEKKSKHRLKLEDQYKKMGMTDEQAQAAANKRIRTEKILAASAALTVAACATYIAVKGRQDRIDGLIKAGDTMKRVEMQDTGGKLHDMFYAAKGKHDEQRYEGLLGAVRKNQTGHAYLMELQANSNIKVASKNNAAKAFGDLYKNDPEFRKSVKDHVGAHFGGRNKVADIDNVSPKNIKKMYENFNANIMFIRNEESGADKKFYSKLKSAGYGAIQDINDMKYSGYKAKNPLIIFDNANKNITVKKVSELTGDLAAKGNRELRKATVETMTEDILRKVGPLSAASLTAATVSTYRSDPNKKYKDEQGGNSKWN